MRGGAGRCVESEREEDCGRAFAVDDGRRGVLLASYLKSLSANVSLAMGPVRVVGEDDKYPKDVNGRSVEPVKFTIRAEKCPNRRGVEAVLRHFAGSVQTMGDVLGRAAAAISRRCIWSAVIRRVGSRMRRRRRSRKLARSSCRIFCRRRPASERRILLAGGSFAERDGTFVNHAGLAQEIHRSIRSPGEAKPDDRILWDLAGRRGLFNLPALRKEIGETIAELKPLDGWRVG